MRANRIVPLFALAVLLVGGLGWSQDRPTAADFDYAMEMEPGESYLLHDSQDTVIEIFIDPTRVTNERVKVQIGDSKTKVALPSGAAIRLQGRVVVSRDTTARAIPKIKVCWRHVDTIFRTYSRPKDSPKEDKKE